MKIYMTTGAGLLAAVGLGTPVWAQQVDPLCANHATMWSSGWHGWFMGPIMMIVFLAIAVAVVVLIVRWLGGNAHGNPGPAQRQAADILKERFARGEIDKEEYEEKRKVIDN